MEILNATNEYLSTSKRLLNLFTILNNQDLMKPLFINSIAH